MRGSAGVARGLLCSVLSAGCFALSAQPARADVPARVVVVYDEPALRDTATFVRLDLMGNGFDAAVVIGEVRRCAERSAEEPAGAGAFVLLTSDGERIEAHVCTLGTEPGRAGNVEGALVDPQGLSILVTEAVNGLLARPLAPEARTQRRRQTAPREDTAPSRRAEPEPAWIEIQARVLRDARSGADWGVVAPRIGVPLVARWSVELELAVSVTQASYSEPEMRLSGSLAWAQVGISEARAVGPVLLRYGVAGGAYMARVVAEAEAPWTDGADSAIGAVFGARGSVRFPASTSWFVSGGLGASMLTPRFRYQMSSSVTRDMGALLLEGSLGFGLRLGSSPGTP